MLFFETERIERAASRMLQELGGPVGAAAILGSGFSALTGLLSDAREVPYSEIRGMPACRAPGHTGRIVAGRAGAGRWALFDGRFHQYEGHGAGTVALPVGLARALGADRVLLTCATGATSEAIAPGTLVLVEDHINLLGTNPLLEIPAELRRTPFLALGDAYDPAGLDLLERCAQAHAVGTRRGVLAALPGPTFETPAEYRALARLGADVVSMSCVPEAIAVRYLGMRLAALCIVANGPARIGEAGADGGDVLRVVSDAVRSRLAFFSAVLESFPSL